jgi:hypothetical protein
MISDTHSAVNTRTFLLSFVIIFRVVSVFVVDSSAFAPSPPWSTLLSASANAYRRASSSPFRDTASSVKSSFAPRAPSSPDRARVASRGRGSPAPASKKPPPRARRVARARSRAREIQIASPHLQHRRRIARRRASFRATIAALRGPTTEFVREFDAPRDRRRRHRAGRWRARRRVRRRAVAI